MHRFPEDHEKRQQWCLALNIAVTNIPKDARISTRHFPNGDTTNLPSLVLGKRFASPKKRPAPFRLPAPPRKKRKQRKQSVSSSSSCSYSPSVQSLESDNSTCSVDENSSVLSTPSRSSVGEDNDLQIIVNSALLARIEVLERQNASLKRSLESVKKPFQLEEIAHDDQLVRAYTGFPSYEVLLAFFDSLEPVVNHLNYWGTKQHSHNRQKKLSPLNCLFLTLVKLRLNLTEQDLAFRFGISTSTVSRYFITWICFLYNHLKESVHQLSKSGVPCLMHSRSIIQPLTSSLMLVSSIQKHPLILCYSLPLGVTTSSIILLSILLELLQMVQSVSYHLLMLDLSLTQNLLAALAYSSSWKERRTSR